MKPGRGRFPVRQAIGLLLTALMVSAAPRPAAAKPHPNYLHYEHLWDQIQKQYEDKEAVVVERNTRDWFQRSSQGKLSIREKRTMTIVVFDLSEDSDVLDRSFFLVPGEKLKNIWVWSHERGAGDNVSWAKKADIHKQKVFGYWTEIKLSIPGLSKSGVCGIEMETVRTGFPFVSEDFVQDIPVVQAEYRIHLLSGGTTHAERINRMFREWAKTITRGDVEEVSEDTDSGEGDLVFRAHDLPARPRERSVDARDMPRAEFFVYSASQTWESLAGYYAERLRDIRPPKSMAKAVRDTLKGKPAREIVAALCRVLDAPENFRLSRSARSGWGGFPNLREVAKERRGGVFDKAVLAHCLLREAGVDSRLMMASSRHRKFPDWRIVDTRFLSTFLIWIPSISEDFLWDVGVRSVPVGEAGPDLYPKMVVVRPEEDDEEAQAVHEFPIGSVTLFEDRRVEWDLSEDGDLQGKLVCRFGGWPTMSDLDPWDRNQDVKEVFQKHCPQGVEADSVTWRQVDWGGMRCNRDSAAVLSCNLEAEATPFGETGWQVEALNWPLPDCLTGLNLSKRTLPVLLDDTVDVVQTVVVHAGSLQVKDLPAPVRVDNRTGGFSCVWEETPGGVTVTRKLRVPAGKLPRDRLPQLAALLDAWDQSRSQTVAFE